MALYLVQHGKSLPKDIDPDQGLSDEGRDDVQRIADVAHGYGVQVRQIRHSTKTRARQTAAIFQAALHPIEPMQEMEGLKPLDDVKKIAERIREEQNLMLVGHLPFMERLTAYLITGSPDKKVFKYQNGGIVCLDSDPVRGDWYVTWTLMPHIG
jgi:phosphohistidine phosphatase